MKIGFSGTQHGMTHYQKLALVDQLARHFEDGKLNEFHHGDCIGADWEAGLLARAMGYQIVLHPPKNPNKRAWSEGATFTHPPKEYHHRNHDIVNDADVMLFGPEQATEQLRSGTWSTYRYAKGQGKPCIVIRPSGQYVDSRWEKDAARKA